MIENIAIYRAKDGSLGAVRVRDDHPARLSDDVCNLGETIAIVSADGRVFKDGREFRLDPGLRI